MGHVPVYLLSAIHSPGLRAFQVDFAIRQMRFNLLDANQPRVVNLKAKIAAVLKMLDEVSLHLGSEALWYAE